MPVYLLGGNKVVNPFQLEQQELLNYLDELQSTGGNYFRNVMSDREPGNIKAFKRLDNGKYDLTKWNENYWEGLSNMLKWSYERDIIVNLTFWDRFDHYDQIGHRDKSREVLWINSPWESVPRQDMLFEKEEDEAYLMAKDSSLYGLYFPKGKGSIGLDLQNFQRPFKMHWIDIGKGQVVLETEVKGGSIISIETPYDVEFGWACAITVIN